MAKKVSKKKVSKKKVSKKKTTKKNTKVKFRISIGDWSQDGHNEYENFAYEANYPVATLQNAYKRSCKLVGLQFNHSDDYTGLAKKLNYSSADYRAVSSFNDSLQLFTEYEQSSMTEEQVEKLRSHGLDVKDADDESYDPQELAELILNFIKLSLPDLKWKETSVKASELKDVNFPTLNGYWCSNLNHQFGYGLFNGY